ncbi:MAG: type II toxin-antitoxin system VapC family toxin [Melioribacteraceae bacterium]|nr:type II toxin-antitoxin system VapC family toxin [Melioribacteraceae bacterium]
MTTLIFDKEHMNKVLLDTNLLIYAIDEDSKYFDLVQELINDDTLKLFTTSKNLSEFLSVVTRIPKSSLSIEEAVLIIEEFQNTFTILYPTEESYSILIDLLNKHSPSGLKIHDYEIASIAISNKIKNVATFNKKDFESIEEIKLVLMQ